MQLNEILIFFAKYIEKETGIVYAEHNYYQLQNRLEEIARLTGLADIQNLFEVAQKGIQGAMRQLLLDLATNNETSFFRDPKVFRAIENHILANRKKNGRHDRFEIWSAASSSGQEAYSLSMLIQEWSGKNIYPVDFRIYATDISERILEKAKRARYSQLEVQRGLPANLMVKYFSKDKEDMWNLASNIREKVEFAKFNLNDTFRFNRKFDLVLIRNVLIYQNVPRKIEIIKKVAESLNDNGILILGAGESLIGLSNAFSIINLDGAVIYEKISGQQKAVA